jgi:hypothetical protein
LSGRKTFTAGEVLQAADVNDFLMDQSVMVFAGTAARGSAIPSPTEGMVTYLSDADELQVYTTDWGAIAGGKLLQVVEGTTTSTVTTTSNTFQSTGLTASITPSSSSNKVLVFASGNFATPNASASCIATIFRGTTAGTDLGGASGIIEIFNTTAGLQANQTAYVLDSPSTTSSQTYTFAFRSSNTSGNTMTANANGRKAVMVLMEIAG